MKLNLGSGGHKLPGYTNVDSQPMENPDVVCDLSAERWPFEDNSVASATASHVLEHIGPEPEKLFHFLRELYRVCKPNAVVKVVVPHPRSDLFLQDPTHVRPVMPGTLLMFSKSHVEELAAKQLFITPFYKYHGVDFAMDNQLLYTFPDGTDLSDPQLPHKIKHLNNIVQEIHMTLRVVK